jgi:hypothetical protein
LPWQEKRSADFIQLYPFMNRNVISAKEASLIYGKLISERTPVTAFFTSTMGDKIVFPGFIESVSLRSGVVVSVDRPPSIKSGLVIIPLARRMFDFSYCEQGELPSETATMGVEVGDTVLLIRFFEPFETLALTFHL